MQLRARAIAMGCTGLLGALVDLYPGLVLTGPNIWTPTELQGVGPSEEPCSLANVACMVQRY